MGLFDLTLTDSVQYDALQAIREVVSQSSAWQNLCEQYTPATAIEKIIAGVHDGPWGAGNFTPEQLANLFCEAQIWAPHEPTELLTDTGNFDADPYQNGMLVLRVRRIIRASERSAGEAKLYNHLLAAADLIGQQMMELANRSQRPRINQVTRTNPAYAELQSSVAQGDYAHWYYSIAWGDLEED